MVPGDYRAERGRDGVPRLPAGSRLLKNQPDCSVFRRELSRPSAGDVIKTGLRRGSNGRKKAPHEEVHP